MPHNQKVENNSQESIGKNISVRMTENQYQRLQRYMKLTRLKSTTYFRRIILGESLKGRSPKLKRAMHTSVNRIYSNVQQITRHQSAKDIDAETTQKLVYLMDRLCEEIYLLANQK
jgi:hypothetical protein